MPEFGARVCDGLLLGFLAGVAMTGEAGGRAGRVCGLGASRDSNEAGFFTGFAVGKGAGFACGVLEGLLWGFAKIFCSCEVARPM